MALGMKLFKFAAGTATGATIGLAVGALLAPQRGADFQRSSRTLVADVKSDGKRAQDATEAELTERFRSSVSDPTALADQQLDPSDASLPAARVETLRTS